MPRAIVASGATANSGYETPPRLSDGTTQVMLFVSAPTTLLSGDQTMSGKVAVVTAGGSGMGAAVARRFAADGFNVAILSSSGKGEALATELGGFGVTGSNQSNDDLKRLVDGAMERWGRSW